LRGVLVHLMSQRAVDCTSLETLRQRYADVVAADDLHHCFKIPALRRSLRINQ
jgi:hypothetical protein